MLLLCDKNTPNFTKDMSVTAREIGGGSKADYLLLSVSDNLFHEPLDSHHLILAAVSLLKAGVSHTRIKVNLRLSDSTFARCVRLYESPWMLEHVVQGNLGLTDVHLLLEAAGGKGGRVALEHLRQDLDRVFAVVRKIIRAKEEALAEQGKELKGAATKVKTYLPRHLIKSWILALKRGERLRQQAKYRYGAGIIQEKLGKRVYLPALSIPLTDEEIDRLTEVAVRLDQLLKQLRPQLVLLAQARANAVINGDGDGADGLGELEAAGLSEVAKILGSMKRHLRHPDDDTDPDREAARREANQNWQDQEEKERKLDDPTAGVGVGPTQPAANQEIEAEVQRLIDELNEQPEADPDE